MKVEDALISAVRQACGFESPSVPLDVDWEKVAELARRHAVLPLMAQYLETTAPEVLGLGFVGASLQAACGTVQAKRVVSRIGTALEAVGVQALLCKGIVLAEWAYGSVIRQVGDIDLLVNPCSYQDAQEVLRALGFSPIKVGFRGEPVSAEWISTDGHLVDLRTSLLERYFLAAPEFDELWGRRVMVSTIDIPTLHPVDHLLYVLLHGLKHQWCRVGWLVDVAMGLKQLSVAEFDELRRRAQGYASARAVSVGLLLCREVLNPSGIPWKKVVPYEDVLVKTLQARYRKRLLIAVPNTAVEKLKNALVHIAACDGVRQQVRYVLGRANNMLTGLR